ncbi:hypothetical protein LCGC14_1692700 [marine sediment metagenome]|uniref:Uncharacterized protein n=1 Tax=marine sediment metagenome TaxID=412755 RepID=A0A0F9KKE5_9ZZZZ
MKLREAGAVLLIIGAAVVGPIESKPSRCLAMNPPWAEVSCIDGEPRQILLAETTAETCARAMKEINAWAMKIKPDGSAHSATPAPKYWGYTTDFIWAIGGMERPVRVLCIPAPSGLKP